MAKRLGRDEVMQAVQRVVVDRVDGRVGDGRAVVGVDLHPGHILEVGDILVADGERIARNGGDRRPLDLAALQVAARIALLARAQGGDAKVLKAGFAQQSVTAQVRGENSAAADEGDVDHGRGQTVTPKAKRGQIETS